MHPFDRIQKEHRPWAAHNFPDTTADQTFTGMVEELGELAHAESVEDMEDAVGDVLIYALHHANLIGVSLLDTAAPALARAPAEASKYIIIGTMERWAIRHGITALGKLAHARLKRQQNIRRDEDHDANEVSALGDVVGAMELMANRLNSDAGTILAKVWDGIVAKRDWKADADKGARKEMWNKMAPAGMFGAAPGLCRHCGTDLGVPGAISYRQGTNYSCEGCHDPDWEVA